jgi:hypothetical protein
MAFETLQVELELQEHSTLLQSPCVAYPSPIDLKIKIGVGARPSPWKENAMPPKQPARIGSQPKGKAKLRYFSPKVGLKKVRLNKEREPVERKIRGGRLS